jgi:hypothetical protein
LPQHPWCSVKRPALVGDIVPWIQSHDKSPFHVDPDGVLPVRRS